MSSVYNLTRAPITPGQEADKAIDMRRERTKELAKTIRAHPRFVDAVRRFTSEQLKWRANLGVLNKVLSNLGRERLLEHATYLHFARGEPGNEHGATFERLAALSAARDQVGARATRTALRLAQISGLLLATRSPADGRLRIFEPSEPLLVITREVYTQVFRIFDDLAPGLDFSARISDDPAFLVEALGRMGRAFLKVEFQPRAEFDVYNGLLQLEGGRAILATAIERHWRNEDLPTSQEIARRFYVSPSQIRGVLKQAESLGLIRTAARGRLLDATPLVEAYLDAVSRFLAVFAEHVFAVEAEVFSGTVSSP
jgi:hypothetical protein